MFVIELMATFEIHNYKLEKYEPLRGMYVIPRWPIYFLSRTDTKVLLPIRPQYITSAWISHLNSMAEYHHGLVSGNEIKTNNYWLAILVYAVWHSCLSKVWGKNSMKFFSITHQKTIAITSKISWDTPPLLWHTQAHYFSFGSELVSSPKREVPRGAQAIFVLFIPNLVSFRLSGCIGKCLL